MSTMDVYLVLILAIVVTLTHAQMPNLSPEDLANFSEANLKCTSQTKVRQTDVISVLSGGKPSDPKIGKYVYCMTRQMGYLDKNGKLNKEKITADVQRIVPSKADVILNSCVKELSTPEETAMSITQCVFKNVLPNGL